MATEEAPHHRQQQLEKALTVEWGQATYCGAVRSHASGATFQREVEPSAEVEHFEWDSGPF